MLQNLDSIIAERVINWFTMIGQPVLCVHDSFIVASILESHIREQMSKAFEEVIDRISGHDSEMAPKVKAMGIAEAYFDKYRTRSRYALEGEPDYGLVGRPLKDRAFDKRLVEHMLTEGGPGYRKLATGEIDVAKIVEGEAEVFEPPEDYYRAE
jgi:hypothetical protein